MATSLHLTKGQSCAASVGPPDESDSGGKLISDYISSSGGESGAIAATGTLVSGEEAQTGVRQRSELFCHRSIRRHVSGHHYGGANRYEEPHCGDGEETDDSPRRSYFLFPAHFGGFR